MIRKANLVCSLLPLFAAACAWTPDIPRSELAEKYLADSSDLTEVEGTILHVRDTGPRDARALILLHGFGSSLHTWQNWAKTLDKSYRVIRFDMPGAGLSPPDSTSDYTDTRVIALIAGLMDQRNIPKATLIGNSIGGRIAWSMAAENPERVDALVLIAPDGFASPTFQYGEKIEAPAILHASKFFLPQWALKPNLTAAYSDPEKLSDETLTRYYELLLATGNRAALIDRLEQTILTDPVPRLKTINAPVLLLWGEDDGVIPVSNAQDYLAALKNAELVSLKGLGHVPMEEDPERSLEPVQKFLKGL